MSNSLSRTKFLLLLSVILVVLIAFFLKDKTQDSRQPTSLSPKSFGKLGSSTSAELNYIATESNSSTFEHQIEASVQVQKEMNNMTLQWILPKEYELISGSSIEEFTDVKESLHLFRSVRVKQIAPSDVHRIRLRIKGFDVDGNKVFSEAHLKLEDVAQVDMPLRMQKSEVSQKRQSAKAMARSMESAGNNETPTKKIRLKLKDGQKIYH